MSAHLGSDAFIFLVAVMVIASTLCTHTHNDDGTVDEAPGCMVFILALLALLIGVWVIGPNGWNP